MLMNGCRNEDDRIMLSSKLEGQLRQVCVNDRRSPVPPRKGEVKLGVHISGRLTKRQVLEFANIMRKRQECKLLVAWGIGKPQGA